MAEMTISDYASIKELENEHRDGCGCGCGNREFAQTQTYNLASQGVTVTERCRN
jgi:hypothetical protein